MNRHFNEISPFELNYNFFNGLSNDWALLCTGNSEKQANIMTISWGGTGILWNKPVAICYVRPQRFTFEILKECNNFTINFFDHNKYKNELSICGTKSGRDINKFEKTGLNLKKIGNNIGVQEAKLILSCKILYSDFLKEENFLEKKIVEEFYPTKDLHKFFIAEITNVLQTS